MIYLIRPQKFGRRRGGMLVPALLPQHLVRLQKIENATGPAAPSDGECAGATAADKREALRDKAQQASYDEYKELVAAWRNLDTKAQGNITVAGIFIAGAFTYLSKFTPGGLAEAGILLLALFFLVGCTLLSLGVLRVRDVPPPYLGRFMRRTVEMLKGKSDEDFLRYLPLFYEEHADGWHESYQRFDRENKRKGDLLWVAQVLLIFAILSVALLVAVKIFTFISVTPA